MDELVKDLGVNDFQYVNVIRNPRSYAFVDLIQIKLILSSETLETFKRHLFVVNNVLVEVVKVLAAVLKDVFGLRVVVPEILENFKIENRVEPRIQVFGGLENESKSLMHLILQLQFVLDEVVHKLLVV
tara:strand:- start:226 stop:612 length:387 start_codon:yes stop_codon:yes gene_type:complete